MAASKSSIGSSKFSLTITMVDSGENSSQMIVGEVPWRLFFFRNKNNEMKTATLNVCLTCDLEDKTDEWWIEAEGRLSILSSKEDKTPIEVKLESKKFMNSSRMSNCYSIQYADFVDRESGYIQNNTFTVECTINPGALIRGPSTFLQAVSCTSQQFIMKIENVDKLGGVKSAKYNLRGVNWFVQFKKLDGKLGVYLHKEKAEQDFTLTVETTFKVKLLPFSEKVNPIVRCMQRKFSSDFESGWGWPDFLAWETLTDKDKQYVQDNVAFFDIAIEIGPWKSICERENLLNENRSLTGCPICLEQLKGHNIVATCCGHLFCSECIKTSIERNPACPVCSTIVLEDDIRKIFL